MNQESNYCNPLHGVKQNLDEAKELLLLSLILNINHTNGFELTKEFLAFKNSKHYQNHQVNYPKI